MSDRLQDLLRQRALIEEHLAWLDREIEAASAAGAAPKIGYDLPPLSSPLRTEPWPLPPSAPVRPLAAPAASSSSYLAGQAAAIARHAADRAKNSTTASDENPQVVAVAEAILDEYRVPPDTLKTDVRKGCLIYFFAAFVVLAVVVGGLWAIFQHHDDAPSAPETRVEKRSEKE